MRYSKLPGCQCPQFRRLLPVAYWRAPTCLIVLRKRKPQLAVFSLLNAGQRTKRSMDNSNDRHYAEQRMLRSPQHTLFCVVTVVGIVHTTFRSLASIEKRENS